MPKRIARWNPARGVWETDQQALCGHSVPYWQTWPTSGTTLAGVAYELPTWVPLTDGSESSSSPGLPTPKATRGGSSTETTELLRTPTAQLAVNGGSQHPDKRKAGGHGPTLADEVEHLLPTPRATDGSKGGPNQRGSSGDLMLPSAVLLPTPTATPYGNNQSPSPGAAVRPSLDSLAPALLPTPTVSDSKGSRNTTANRSSGAVPWHSGDTLADAVTLLPTPTSDDATSAWSRQTWERRRASGEGWSHLTQVVSHDLGEPTSPPSDAGNESSDE